MAEENESVESFTLLVTNVPAGTADDERLIMFIENVTGEDVDYIEFNRTKDKALLSFKEPQIKPEQAIEFIRQKQLGSTTLDVRLAPEVNRLFVKNLKSDVDEDLLGLHFEHRRVCGLDDVEVTVVDFISEKHAAIINYSDDTACQNALEYKEHCNRLGPDVIVEMCSCLATIDDITDDSDKVSETSEDVQCSLDGPESSGRPPRGSRGGRRPRGRPRVRGEYRGSRRSYGNTRGGHSDTEFSPTFDEAGQCMPEPGRRSWRGRRGGRRGCNTGEIRTAAAGVPSLMDINIDVNVCREFQHPNEWTEGTGLQTVSPLSADVESPQFRYDRSRGGRPRSSYRGGRSDRGYQGMRGGRGLNTSMPNLAEACGGMSVPRRDSSSGLSDDVGDRAASSRSSARQTYSKEIQISHEVGTEKCQVLIFILDELKIFKCRVHVNQSRHSVFVTSGTEDNVNQTAELIYTKLLAMRSNRVACISPALSIRLSCLKGLKMIREMFRQYATPAVFYIDRGSAHVIAPDETVLQNAVALLELNVKVLKLPYTQSQSAFLRSEDWKSMVANVEKLHLVSVQALPDPESVLMVEGLVKCVDEAEPVLRDQLETKSISVFEIPMSPGELYYLKAYYRDYCKKSKAVLNINIKGRKLEIRGNAKDAENLKSCVEKFQQELISEDLEPRCPGITKEMFELEDDTPKLTITALEKKYHCVIQVEVKALAIQKPRFSRTSSVPSASTRAGISVVHGNIVEFDKADVLVNSIASDTTDLNEAGAVARSFFNSGGPQLQQEYVNALLVSDETGCVLTSATGNLHAKKVIHIQMRKYVPKRGFIKALQEKLEQCLAVTISLGLTSIAFPTIGCGNLHYPVEKVAKCFQRIGRRTGLQIYIVVQDYKSMLPFQQLISGVMPQQSDVHLPEPVGAVDDHRSSVVFKLFGIDRNLLNQARDELEKKLDVFVYKTSVKFPAGLTTDQLKTIYRLKKSAVDIQIDEKTKTIFLMGNKKVVEETSDDVSEMLNQLSLRSSDTNYLKQNLPRNEFLPKFSRDPKIYAPSYWKKYDGNLSDTASSQGYKVPVDDSVKQAVTALVLGTWHSSLIGQGADATGLSYRNINVTNVWQIENVSLYKGYITHMKECYMQLTTPVPKICGLQGEKDIETVPFVTGKLKDKLVMPELNECFLLHGTTAAVKDAIINQSVDFRLGSSQALFGQGCYFAESSTKADQYADSRTARVGPGQPLYMFVFRVLLGRAYVCREPRQFKRPPCTDQQCLSDTCHQHSLFDSVIGTHNYLHGAQKVPSSTGIGSFLGFAQQAKVPAQQTRRLLFREFVVYDRYKCYPEFLVEYTRQ